MLEFSLRRRLLAAASPSRLALAGALLLAGLASALVFEADGRLPAAALESPAEVAVAELDAWQPPWLRPPRSVELQELQTRRSLVDPLPRRRRRHFRAAVASPTVADLLTGTGTDVPAPVAAPDPVRARAGGGDTLPRLATEPQRVALPEFPSQLPGYAVSALEQRKRKPLEWQTGTPPAASSSRPAAADPGDGGSAPPTKPRPPHAVSAQPVPLEPSLPVVPVAKPMPAAVVSKLPVSTPTPRPLVSDLPVAAQTPAPAVSKLPVVAATPLPVVSKPPVAKPVQPPVVSQPPVAKLTPPPVAPGPPVAKPTPHPVASAPPVAKPTPPPVVSKLPVLAPAPPPSAPTPTPVTPTLPVHPVAKLAPPVAAPTPVVSRQPGVPGVPSGPGPAPDVIVWQHDDVENLVAADAIGHGRGLQVAGGGHLSGSGRVAADVRVAGFFAPGHSPGYVEIEGDYVQDPGATLEIELAGTDAADFDRVVVEGSAYLSGVIQVLLLDGFMPSAGDVFEVLLAAAIFDLGVDIRLPDLGSRLALQADWISSEDGDALVLWAQGGAASAAVAVPEPATALLLAAGLLGLALQRRRG